MKTLKLLLCMAFVPSGLAFGQVTGMAVHDLTVHAQLTTANVSLSTIDTTLKSIDENIAKQLDLAKEDTQTFEDIKKGVQDTVERLDSLLERIGNPADVRFGDIGDYGRVKHQVSNALEDGIVKDRPDVDPDDRSLFDSEFTEGIIEPLNNRFEVKMDTNNDGKYETENPERDVKRYIGETEQIKAVKEYYRVRDAAVARREALLEVLKDVLEDMQDNSNDFAHLAKQTALVEVIQGQLQVCSNDINNAFNDAAVKGLQVYALNSAKTKADAEPSLYEMDKQKEKLESIADKLDDTIDPVTQGDLTLPTGAKDGEYLPWINRFQKTATTP